MDLSHLSEQQIEVASVRLQWVQAWESSDIKNAHVFCDAMRDDNPPSAQSLYRYREAYARGGLVALAPKWGKTSAGTGGRNSLSKDVMLQLQAAWLRQSKPSMRDAVRVAEINCGHAISYSAARRFFQGLDVALVAKMREGDKALNDKWLPHVMQDYNKFSPGQRFVMDHHTLDVVVRDFRGKLFRPYLTLCTDFRSRKPLGWCVCQSPNGFSIARALQMAVKAYGCPQEILIDNGKDFNSKFFRGKETERVVTNEGMQEKEFVKIAGVFDTLGVRVINSTPYRGQSKNIERFFRDVATQFAKWVPTYVGSNTVARPEEAKLFWRGINKQEKRSVGIDMPYIDKALGSWLEHWAETHSHSGMGMDGQTPNAVFASRDVVRPVSDDAMRLLFSRVELRKVRRQGVQLDAWYWSDALIGLQGENVQVRRPLDDVSYVWVCDVHGRKICKAYADVFVGGTEDALQYARNAGKKMRKRVRDAERIIREAQEVQVTPVEHAINWSQEHVVNVGNNARVVDVQREIQVRKIAHSNVESVHIAKEKKTTRKGLLD